jgi:uncharacterized protein
VKWLDEYTIPYHGLSQGMHEYDFEVKKRFFEHFENPDIPGGEVSVSLKLNKKSAFMELDFQIIGYLSVVCDRCLEVFNKEVDLKEKLYIRFGDVEEEESENVIVLPREETRLNIAQYIYEFSALNLPVQRIHPEDKNGNPECNKEMLKKLDQFQAKEEEKVDPRWEALLKLKNNK